MPGFPASPAGVRGLGEHAADLVERSAVGRGGRPGVLPDRGGVDLDDLADAGQVQTTDMPGQRGGAQQRPRGRDEAVQDQGGLAGPGRPGQRGQPVQREGGGNVVQVVQVADVQDDLPAGTGPRWTVTSHGLGPGQERADNRVRVGFQLARGALGDHRTALGAGRGAEFDDPVRGTDDLPLVLHHDHGIAVPGQGRERLAQPGDVARVQPDRRLVQHVQHARGAGAHRRGELDALPLPGRQRGAGPVEGQVAQPDVEQRREPAVQFGEQTGRHPAQLGGQSRGQAGREAPQLVQGERADLGDVAAAELRSQRFWPQPGAVAHRADAGDEETLHQAAGALVVAAQGAFDRGDCIVVVDRQLHGPRVPARAQRHLLPYRFTAQHDVALLIGQRPVGHIEPDPELACGIHRQPPPAGVPRQYRAFGDRLVRIGNQGADVDFGPYA